MNQIWTNVYITDKRVHRTQDVKTLMDHSDVSVRKDLLKMNSVALPALAPVKVWLVK